MPLMLANEVLERFGALPKTRHMARSESGIIGGGGMNCRRGRKHILFWRLAFHASASSALRPSARTSGPVSGRESLGIRPSVDLLANALSFRWSVRPSVKERLGLGHEGPLTRLPPG